MNERFKLAALLNPRPHVSWVSIKTHNLPVSTYEKNSIESPEASMGVSKKVRQGLLPLSVGRLLIMEVISVEPANSRSEICFQEASLF